MSIVVENLRHVYHAGTALEAEALSGVSMTVERGGWTSVVGRTGSGKSTLAQHLNAILRPDSGSVTVDGIAVPPGSSRERRDLRPLRRKVGLVFQYPEQQLFEETVRDEVAFAPRNWGTPERETVARVSRALSAVGLDDSYLERSPFGLSGGEKRRVAIASVLASMPDYLVLDEPTAGLDGAGKAALLALLDGIHRDGTGIVLVTHDLEVAFSRSDSVLVLERGRCAASGSPGEVAERLYENPTPGLLLPDVMRVALMLRARGARVPLTCDPEKLAQACLRARRRGR